MSSDDEQKYTYEEEDGEDDDDYCYDPKGGEQESDDEEVETSGVGNGAESQQAAASSSSNRGAGGGPTPSRGKLLRVLASSLDDCRMDLMGNDDVVQDAQLTVVGDWGKLWFDVVVDGQATRQEYTLAIHESPEQGQVLHKVEVGANMVAKLGFDRARHLATVVNLYLPPLVNGTTEECLERYLKEATRMAFTRGAGAGTGADMESFTTTLIETARPLFRSKNLAYRAIKSLIYFNKHLDGKAFCPQCGLQGARDVAHDPCISVETQAAHLKSFFLSPRAAIRSSLTFHNTNSLPVLTDDQLLAIMKTFVPQIAKIRDRTGSVPAYTYIISTYRQGLPNFQRLPTLQQHTIGCLRYIFSKIQSVSPRDGAALMNQIVDSFRSCQAEQGRVIDAVYGAMSGRDKSFQVQLLTLVDAVRQHALDTASMTMRGGQIAINMGSQDMPHVQNGYRLAFGEEVGVSHMQMEAARSDMLAHRPDPATVNKVKTLMLKAFSVKDVAEAFCQDVNQQDPMAQRVVDRDSLAKWASTASNFDAHSIYYDETRPQAYKDAKPLSENRFQPFLSLDVAHMILTRAFQEEMTK